MTREQQKIEERFFAEECAKRLSVTWAIIDEGENPDLIIKAGGHQFGLEVSEVFLPQPQGVDFKPKQEESHRQKLINELKKKYEAQYNILLIVKLVGYPHHFEEALQYIIPTLEGADLASKPALYQDRLEIGPHLRMHVTKVPERSEWFYVNDRGGFVLPNPTQVICEAINDKASRLTRYQIRAGDDVRLLLYADHTQNSGKLALPRPVQIDTQGFTKVYFYSYPEGVCTFTPAHP